MLKKSCLKTRNDFQAASHFLYRRFYAAAGMLSGRRLTLLLIRPAGGSECTFGSLLLKIYVAYNLVFTKVFHLPEFAGSFPRFDDLPERLIVNIPISVNNRFIVDDFDIFKVGDKITACP